MRMTSSSARPRCQERLSARLADGRRRGRGCHQISLLGRPVLPSAGTKPLRAGTAAPGPVPYSPALAPATHLYGTRSAARRGGRYQLAGGPARHVDTSRTAAAVSSTARLFLPAGPGAPWERLSRGSGDGDHGSVVRVGGRFRPLACPVSLRVVCATLMGTPHRGHGARSARAGWALLPSGASSAAPLEWHAGTGPDPDLPGPSCPQHHPTGAARALLAEPAWTVGGGGTRASPAPPWRTRSRRTPGVY